MRLSRHLKGHLTVFLANWIATQISAGIKDRRERNITRWGFQERLSLMLSRAACGKWEIIFSEPCPYFEDDHHRCGGGPGCRRTLPGLARVLHLLSCHPRPTAAPSISFLAALRPDSQIVHLFSRSPPEWPICVFALGLFRFLGIENRFFLVIFGHMTGNRFLSQIESQWTKNRFYGENRFPLKNRFSSKNRFFSLCLASFTTPAYK